MTGKIDIVAHSMGYAFAVGIADALIQREILVSDNNLGGFYIIAPENANGAIINGNLDEGIESEVRSNIIDKTDFVWQYGVEELLSANPHLPHEQDGIAPQVGIPGLGFSSSSISSGRIRYAGDESNFSFDGSHYSTSYDWIITLLNSEQRGYVIKMN